MGCDLYLFSEHENLDFEDEQYVNIIITNNGESDYNFNMDLLTISY